MKTAIYIEDGNVQLVITPETEWEKKALGDFEREPLTARIFSGSFYDCRGGWTRQSKFYPSAFEDANDKSLILSISERQSIRGGLWEGRFDKNFTHNFDIRQKDDGVEVNGMWEKIKEFIRKEL